MSLFELGLNLEVVKWTLSKFVLSVKKIESWFIIMHIWTIILNKVCDQT
jgi:hypothetical protein